jgi:hypothetical protein
MNLYKENMHIYINRMEGLPTTTPICGSCKCYYTPIQKRNGEMYKCCSRCRETANKYKCLHNKSKYKCLECNGSSMCEHGREKQRCRSCCDSPIRSIIQNILSSNKARDEKCNRYNPSNFITYDHVYGLILQSNNKCFYCLQNIQYHMYGENMATIERLDNNIGHDIGNCVIACRSCNYRRVGVRHIDPTIDNLIL